MLQRVEEVLRIRLDGAEFWDVREYVREKELEEGSPWFLEEDRPPLSDSQLWRYVAKADAAIAESCRASSKKLVRRHLAQRRSLYAKAVSAGDFRVALAALDSEAELLGLFPPKKKELTGANGSPLNPEKKPQTAAEIAADLAPYKGAFAMLYASELGRPDEEKPAYAKTSEYVHSVLSILVEVGATPRVNRPSRQRTLRRRQTPPPVQPPPASFPRPVGAFPRPI